MVQGPRPIATATADPDAALQQALAEQQLRQDLGSRLMGGLQGADALSQQAGPMVAETLVGMLPGAGDAMAARDSQAAGSAMAQALRQGEYGEAAKQGGLATLAGLGALPMVPSLAGIFIGAKGAKNIPGVLEKLDEAKRLAAETKGEKPFDEANEIFKKTGWFEGIDGEWRYEISDLPAKLKSKDMSAGWAPLPASKVLHHPELLQAHPEVGQTRITVDPRLRQGKLRQSNVLGWYSPGSDTVGLRGKTGLGNMETLLHELQHKVQAAEGWPEYSRGTSVKAAGSFDKYHGNPGEIEARDVSSRWIADKQGVQKSMPSGMVTRTGQFDAASAVADSLGSVTKNKVAQQVEYDPIARLYQRAGEIAGVDPAAAQSLGWFGSGDKTGLASAPKTVAQLMNERINVTAQALGLPPEQIVKLLREGRIPLLSVGGAGLAGAAAMGAGEQSPEGGA